LGDRSSAQTADPTSSTSASVIAVDLKLAEIDAISVTAYIEQLGTMASKPTIKQHLAAIRQLFDYLTTGGVLDINPAASVRGPKYMVRRGKTSVLSLEEGEDN
jgi:integrase/recombinase XerD